VVGYKRAHVPPCHSVTNVMHRTSE